MNRFARLAKLHRPVRKKLYKAGFFQRIPYKVRALAAAAEATILSCRDRGTTTAIALLTLAALALRIERGHELLGFVELSLGVLEGTIRSGAPALRRVRRLEAHLLEVFRQLVEKRPNLVAVEAEGGNQRVYGLVTSPVATATTSTSEPWISASLAPLPPAGAMAPTKALDPSVLASNSTKAL